MYLEVYVYNSIAVTDEQIDDESSLPSFPEGEVLKGDFDATVPGIKWSDEVTGLIDLPEIRARVIFDSVHDCKIIYVRIFTGSDPFKVVLDLCRTYGWTSYTPENGRILQLDMDTLKYWEEYQAYNNSIYQTFYKGRQL